MANLLVIILVLLLIERSSSHTFEADGLSINYYKMSCPFLDLIVKNTVFGVLRSDPTLAAGLVRMHFHDCFVQGCDASVLIDSTKNNTAEKDSIANLSLRGYDTIDCVKEQVERHCPGVVSCADIVAMAARDAVSFTGGPIYDIPKGRKDGRRSKVEDKIDLPFPTSNASDLINAFGNYGFNVKEMVALTGAHTLGVAHCSSFISRLNPLDVTLDPQFAQTLSRKCVKDENAEQSFDITRTKFDNAYFNALQRRDGVLVTDQALYSSLRTRGLVNDYAMNQALFFLDFQQAIIKMGLLDVKQGSNGEVRINCRKIN